MRRFLSVPIFVALVATYAFMAFADTGVGPYWDKTFSEGQTCYGDGGCIVSAPYWDAGFYSDAGCCSAPGFSAGASTQFVDAFRILICAPSGQTLTGTGTLRAYYCDHYSQLCYEDPQLHQAVAPDGGGQCFTVPDFKIGFVTTEPGDVVEFVPNVVGVTPPDGGALLERIYRHTYLPLR